MTVRPLASKVPLEVVRTPLALRLFVSWSVPAPAWTRLLKLAPPLSRVWAAAPSKVTVLAPGVNVPPALLQLPETVKAPDGAVSVPLLRVTLPLTSTSPVEPVKVPPETVSPPLKVCVAVEALYSPPLMVARLPTVVARPPALKMPLLTVRVPLISRALVESDNVPPLLLITKLSKSFAAPVPPLMSIWAPEPLKVTVKPLVVTVPLLVKLPLTVMSPLSSRVAPASIVTLL